MLDFSGVQTMRLFNFLKIRPLVLPDIIDRFESLVTHLSHLISKHIRFKEINVYVLLITFSSSAAEAVATAAAAPDVCCSGLRHWL